MSSRIRVAFGIWTLEGIGGSEKVVYDLARSLDRKFFEVFIISFSDGPVRRLYEDIGIEVYCVEKKQSLGFRFLRNLHKILKKHQIDLINAHHFGPFIYLNLAGFGLKTKIIYTEHSRWQLERLSFVKRIILRILMIRTAALIAISNQILDYYLNNIEVRKNKVYLIKNGIDVSSFQRGDGKTIRRELGLKNNEKVVGIVANIRPEKNHRLLMSAFSIVASHMKDVRLVIVGLDCMDGELQRIASQQTALDKVIFLGSRSDVPDILKTFTVFCLPSIHEGMPLTVLEAMAAGVPVIGADVIGINEIVRNNVNGMLFPSGDEVALAESICRLLSDEDLRQRLAREAERFVSQEFFLADKVQQYDEVFKKFYKIP